MDKALSYMALARKAGRIELGEEPAGAASQSGKACLVVVAGDASDHTWRRAQGFVSGTGNSCIRLPFTKDQLGQAIGREALAMAAFTDPALALAFVKALDADHGDAVAALEQAVQRKSPKKQGFRGKKRGRSSPAAK